MSGRTKLHNKPARRTNERISAVRFGKRRLKKRAVFTNEIRKFGFTREIADCPAFFTKNRMSIYWEAIWAQIKNIIRN